MEEKVPGKQAPEITESNDETLIDEQLQTLIIEDVRYKTRFNRKFLSRKNYIPQDPKKILSFIPGTIVQVYTKKGAKVKEGDKLLDLEAMKMVNTVFSPIEGVLKEVLVKPGDLVTKNQLLIQFR
ncbi:MAG TPA: acetyl-CoA carboxylase biotin carboxyl carrier protein subunit [Bacteroidales bacterium]|nr:acetyl-CoA carboxylase biotin carboxyl carrier protein subunit [Bacteroidales bacterium]